jgi:ParB/RepB/Spo0J family partition protein
MPKAAATPAKKPARAKAHPIPDAPESRTTRDFHISGPDTAPPAYAEGRQMIAYADIQADPNNPRKHFDADALDELAASIAKDGLLQNLLVRPVTVDGLTVVRLVAGERRWRAVGRAVAMDLLAADVQVPVDLRFLTDEQAAYLALLENMARKDLKPIEEARHFKLLVDQHGATTASIAERTGFTQRFVQKRLQLLDLNTKDMAAFEAGDLPLEEAFRRLSNYPKPLEISPAAWLVWLEIYAKAIAEPASDYSAGYTLCRDPGEDPAFRELMAGSQAWTRVTGPHACYEQGVDTGFHRIGYAHATAEAFALRFSVDIAAEDQRAGLLTQLQQTSMAPSGRRPPGPRHG